MPQHYDLIGDIHGYAETLEHLLQKLGYDNSSGFYAHRKNKVIFLGDFVDRGPHQAKTIDIVRAMVDNGAALSVMGNHEFNAISYYTPSRDGHGFLRAHSARNTHQHQAFLDAFENDPAAYAEVIEWFSSLPLWLSLDGLNVVHACWDESAMACLQAYTRDGQYLSPELLHAASDKTTPAFTAVETLLKGKEIPLPEGASFHDKDGTKRHNIRVRWWDDTATTYQQTYLGPEHARTDIPDDPIEGDHLVQYHTNYPPVFLGHYWLQGAPKPLADNIACLDYSIAKPNGKLVAYRWQGERVLRAEHFVSQVRVE